MESIFLFASFICATYFIFKIIEIRFIKKEGEKIKFLIRDTLLVYFSVIVTNFYLDYLGFHNIKNQILNIIPDILMDGIEIL